MKRIKYRFWLNGKAWEVRSIEFGEYVVIHTDGGFWSLTAGDEGLAALTRYTGLPDAHDNEICQGDIMRDIDDHEEQGVVEWDDKDAMFTLLTVGNVSFNFSQINSKHWEIIGNIHERNENDERV